MDTFTNIHFSDIVGYFKNIATQHNDIAHVDGTNPAFFRMDIDEILSALKAGVADTVFILENFDGNFECVSDAQAFQTDELGFAVLKKAARKGDYNEMNTLLDATFEIAKDCIARMRADFRAQKRPMTIFNFKNVKYNKIGPQWDNWHGWRFQVQFSNPQSFAQNPAKWLDAYNPKPF